MTWEIKCVKQGEERKYLEDGWEPFAVVPQDVSYDFTNTTTNRRETAHRTVGLIYLQRWSERSITLQKRLEKETAPMRIMLKSKIRCKHNWKREVLSINAFYASSSWFCLKCGNTKAVKNANIAKV